MSDVSFDSYGLRFTFEMIKVLRVCGNMEENHTMKTICFGEILFDVFPSYDVLGGAPLNVAIHLARLGAESLIVSSVGDDERGDRAISEIKRNGLSVEFINKSEYDTGIAQITIDGNKTDYEFNDPAAWDDVLVSDNHLNSLKKSKIDALVFGTLALRSEQNEEALDSLLSLGISEVLYDVNLRKEFFSASLIDRCIERSTILKLNNEEASVISRLYGTSENELPDYFLSKFNKLKMVLVTEGEHGLTLHTRDMKLHENATKCEFVDSVGAGDSVSAAFLNCYLKGCSLEECLKKASILASAVVSSKGATSDYPEGLLEILSQ